MHAHQYGIIKTGNKAFVLKQFLIYIFFKNWVHYVQETGPVES